MKIYEISVLHHEGESLSLYNLKRELEKQINADSDLIEQVKQDNLALAEKLRAFCENPENAIYAGAAVTKYLGESPIYSYIKSIEFGGTLYDLEIDHLTRTADLCEIL